MQAADIFRLELGPQNIVQQDIMHPLGRRMAFSGPGTSFANAIVMDD